MARYLAARDGRYGGCVGQLVCPVSRLSGAGRASWPGPPRPPVDLSLVVDTGLGAVPKALSTVFSRASLLTPRTVETAAPPDVDAMWLERVSEFVPEDVVAVVEPRRPTDDDPKSTVAWLDAVRRVAEHGCAPKLRCGGAAGVGRAAGVATSRSSCGSAVEAGRGFTVLGLRAVVRAEVAGAGPARARSTCWSRWPRAVAGAATCGPRSEHRRAELAAEVKLAVRAHRRRGARAARPLRR